MPLLRVIFCWHDSGAPNEIWSYGSEVEAMLKGVIDLRESLRPYIAGLAREVSVNGTPPMRYELSSSMEAKANIFCVLL